MGSPFGGRLRLQRRYAFLAVGLLLVSGACSSEDSAEEETGPIPVIVDYSPTVSDVGALIYLLSHPNVEVLAVTMPVTGEAGCELGADVTLGILAMFEDSETPVACDPDRPAGAESWPEAFLAGADALALSLPEPVSTLDPRPAHQLIADVAAASERPVLLYAVAPLTNVARALDSDPDLEGNLDELVIMGGAVDVPGNVAGTDSEWNLWIDVPATSRVFRSDVTVTLVPLDATNDVPTPGFWDIDLADVSGNEPTRYLASMVKVFPQTTSGNFYMWDELAAAVAAGEEPVILEEMTVTVVESRGRGYGSTVRDPGGRVITVATGVADPAAFYGNFLSIVSGTEAAPRQALVWGEEDVPHQVGPSSHPEEVLGFWMVAALKGDVAVAESVVAPDAPWGGLGDSPEVFVAGSGPYEAFDISTSCTSADRTALCSAAWNDLWLDANPDIERGAMQVRAVVDGGTVVEFEEFSFGPEIPAAFDAHLTWLAGAYPDRLGVACGGDGASPECSELLVATVAEWIAQSQR
ncbi:MAG: nucleoside hydrolase [Acidimicrobiia bacterium]|nr:nucleoside hydrolase [Acidimicrobiia bacterium]